MHLAKINVDELDSLAAKYEVSISLVAKTVSGNRNHLILFAFQVSSIPSVFAIKNGKTVDQFVGVKDEDEIQAFVDKLLVKNWELKAIVR